MNQTFIDTVARRLHVLFVAGFDSSNYAYVEMVRELVARGHACTVLVDDTRDDINNKMFTGAGIATTPLSQFPKSRLGDVDFVFSGPFLRRQQRALFGAVYEQGKFVVSSAGLFSSVTMRVSADLVITNTEHKFGEFADNGLSYNMVAIGNPQYDALVRARRTRPDTPLTEIRNVLVVDQGAYPLGHEGKRQLAGTLVSIARNNPRIKFTVKPRYLPNEYGQHLHTVSEHIYDYLTDVPENLVLLHGPSILEELLLDFDAMITTWSTAHLAAIALDIPLLLIDGLDSADVYDIRQQRVDEAYDVLRETGCVVHWQDLQSGECPFAYASEEYASEQFYDATVPAAPCVANLLERIDEELLSKDLALTEKSQLPYHEFMDRLGSLPVGEKYSQRARMNQRLTRGLNTVIQDLVFDHRCMGFALNMRQMLPLWEWRVSERATARDVDSLVREARRIAMRLKEAYFHSHRSEVAEDKFVQDHYFDWLLQTGRYELLWTYDGPVVVPESLEYNRGIAYLKRGRVMAAARRITHSFGISLRKLNRELKKDRNIQVIISRADSSPLARTIVLFLHLYGEHEALADLDIPPRPGFEVLVFHKMHALVALGRVSDAITTHARYSDAAPSIGTAPAHAGIRNRLRRSGISLSRSLLRRYAMRLAHATTG